jgi:sulfhydrogenase subunit beta (sulfur reductase)
MRVDVWMLPKTELAAWTAEQLRRFRVVAPVRRSDAVHYAAITDAADVAWDYRYAATSIKGALLPQVECLARYARTLDDYNDVSLAPVDDTPTLLLAVRPCDARSLLMLDGVFLDGAYSDPLYASRRANALVVSLACQRPRPVCFCHALGSGPYDAEGSDVVMQDAGDALLVRVVSERGHVFLAEQNLPDADAVHLEGARAIETAANARLADVGSFVGIEEGLAGLFEHSLWAGVSEKCLACGTCTYVCPQCHCFNIEDRLLAADGERVRAWDSCMYPEFTVHASGHNPRPDQAARWRQRTMHKFEYLPRNVGRYGCVGCGRCVQACPVRLDIRDVLRAVVRAAAEVAAPQAIPGE